MTPPYNLIVNILPRKLTELNEKKLPHSCVRQLCYYRWIRKEKEISSSALT